MRYQKCPRCKTTKLRTESNATVDGISYRLKKCHSCGEVFYTKECQISHGEWREARNYYEKKKRLERERRRESASRGILEAHQKD